VSSDHNKRLILGSSSPRRRELLGAAGLVFDVARPDIDETPLPGERGNDYVVRLSRDKALAIPLPSEPSLILTADTTVEIGGEIVGKPADAAEAWAMLRLLRGRTHHVHTGISVRDGATGEVETTLTTTSVIMRDYADEEVAAYIASGDPFDKAGAYAIQHPAFRPVERLEGCHTNVMGLPLCTACAMLARHGLSMPQPPGCSPERLPCVWANGRRVG
jgi:septum formation protein